MSGDLTRALFDSGECVHEPDPKEGVIWASIWKRSPLSFGRVRGRRKECGAGELRRLLHQADQRRRVLRHADDLDLVALDPQLRHVGGIGQRPRDGLQHHDARGRGLLAFGATARAAEARPFASRRSAARRCVIRRCRSLRSDCSELPSQALSRSDAAAARPAESRMARSRRGTLMAGPITLRSDFSISLILAASPGGAPARRRPTRHPGSAPVAAAGLTFSFDVAANITSIRSFATSFGALQPNTASLRGPGCQAIDLRADHAVEEIAGLARKIEQMRHRLRSDGSCASMRLPRNATFHSADNGRLWCAIVQAERQLGQRRVMSPVSLSRRMCRRRVRSRWIRRARTSRPATASTAPTTAPIH